MATAKGGFDCDFVEPPPKSLECPICLLTLRDPHVISCCGNHFCHPCVQRIQQDGKPCPLCNDPDFTVFLHKGVMREVNALIVHCPQKELGCQWVGELGKLQQHLSPGAGVKGGGCGYVEVECAYQCGGRFQRHTIREHELELCPNRPLEVQLSSMTKKLTAALAENHSLKEEIAQVREKQEQEIGKLAKKLEAALQVIRVEKDEMKAELGQLKHTQEAAATAQTNLSQEHQAMKKELTQLKQAQDQQKKATAQEHQSLTREVNLLKQTQDKQKRTADQEHHSLLQQVNQLKQNQQTEVARIKSQQQSFAKAAVVDNQLQVIKQDVRALAVKQDGVESKCTFLESCLTPMPPFNFTMVNFEWWKKEGLTYFSDPFYSHPGGYKMQAQVHPGGSDSGKGTNVSVYVRLMRGEYDDKLHWPFQGKVTFQIYNWNSNAWGFGESISFHDAPAPHSARPSADSISNPGWGYQKFVARGELPVLRYPDDIVRFRVIKVEV